MNFSWEIYKELNPDLINVGLKTKSEFEAAMGASIPVPFNLGGKQSPAATPITTNPIPVLPSNPSNNPSLTESENVNSRIRIAEPSSYFSNEELGASSNRDSNSTERNSRRIEVGTKKNLNTTIDLFRHLPDTWNDWLLAH